MNPINKKETKCFQRAVAWSHEQIGKHPERITKIKPFINKHNWKERNFSSGKDDWKQFEKNNVAIALNVLYPKKVKKYPAYVWKHNSNHEKQVIFLMIPIGEGWQYSWTKKLLALLRGITSQHQGDFYCLNCLHSLATENKRKPHRKECENKDFCNVIMHSEGTRI